MNKNIEIFIKILQYLNIHNLISFALHINMWRALFLFLLNTYYNIIYTPPTLGDEMGSKKNDDLNNDSPVIFSYYAKIRGILIITIMCIYHIILYHDLPISLFDCMMMLWSTIGLTISLWAYYEMGRLYTFNIGIRGETNNDPNTKHKIIRSGPYKFVAHPGYTGQIMFLSGIILFCRLPYVALVSIILFIMYQYYNRITSEELMLKKHFGEEYSKFLLEKGRKRLIPFIY